MDDQLPANVNYLLSSSKQDVFFNVGPESGPNELIGSFKIFLMAHSEPMCKMLEESEIAENGEIALPDIEPKSFKDFLKCVYGGSDVVIKHMHFEECVKLMYIADKYLVSQLKKTLVARMKVLLPKSLDNLFTALLNPVCFQDDTFKNSLSEIIKRDTDKIFADERFTDISSDSLLFIIKQEPLFATELDVFKAAVNWAENKANSTDGALIREYLTEHLPFFRFQAISCEEFCANVIPTCVLTAEEACEVCISIASKSETLSNLQQSPQVHSYLVENMDSFRSGDSRRSNFSNQGQYLWRFLVDRTEANLGLYIQCQSQSEKDTSWECNAEIELIVVNQCGKADWKRSFKHKFNSSGNNSGYSPFMSWDFVSNPLQGFIKHGYIVVVAYITLL